jgi:hypothetical protein
MWIAPKVDRGFPVNAIVERVTGTYLSGSKLSLNIRSSLDGEAPKLLLRGPGRTLIPNNVEKFGIRSECIP